MKATTQPSDGQHVQVPRAWGAFQTVLRSLPLSTGH
jgi:hypothetical protein